MENFCGMKNWWETRDRRVKGETGLGTPTGLPFFSFTVDRTVSRTASWDRRSPQLSTTRSKRGGNATTIPGAELINDRIGNFHGFQLHGLQNTGQTGVYRISVNIGGSIVVATVNSALRSSTCGTTRNVSPLYTCSARPSTRTCTV